MKLSDVFESLYYGELAQFYTGDGNGGIEPDDYRKYIKFINDGLIEIYRKFSLRQKELTLQMYSSITEYTLTYDFAESNTGSSEDPLYILDSSSTFADDVLQVVEVRDEDDDEVPLNDKNRERSPLYYEDTTQPFAYTPEEKVLKVVNPQDGATLTVIYRAYPVAIALTETEPESVLVPLPDQFLSALCAYVGHRAHLALPEGQTSKASSYMGRFLGICNDIKANGTVNEETVGETNSKFERNGWV